MEDAARATPSIRQSVAGIAFDLTFDLTPAVEAWEPDGDDYRNGPYRLAIAASGAGDDVSTLLWELSRDDGQPVELNRLTVGYQMPLVALYRLWPTSGIASDHVNIDLPWSLDTWMSAVSFDPVLIGLDTDGTNTLTVGFSDTAIETHLTGRMGRSSPEAEAGFTSWVYHVQWERPCVEGIIQRGTVLKDGLFISTKHESWFEALSRYTAFVDERRSFVGHQISERALLPMWHSWYAFENEITEDRIQEQIAPAKELGFGTMQLDAGWNTGRDWVVDEGYYLPNRDRFPNFEGVIADIKAAGLSPVAHWSPPWIGKSAPNRAELEPAIQGAYDWGRGRVDNLCPRTPQTFEHIVNATRVMVADLGFEGLWYDFIDSLPVNTPCTADHEHVFDTNGEAWSAILDASAKAARDADPDCLLIYRRSHANIHTKPYLTHLWPADAPFDYTKNRREVVTIRAYSHGVLSHACCTCWSPQESDATVARHLASVVLAGVPAVSIDLTRFPESHLDGIRRWLAFYREHRWALMTGELRPLTFMPPSAVIRVESQQQAFLGYFEAIPSVTAFSRSFDELYLFNGYDANLRTRLTNQTGTFSIEIADGYLRPLANSRTVHAGPAGLDLDLTVPVPSMIKLTRTH